MAGSRSPEVAHGPPRSVDAPPNPAPTTNLSAGVPGTTSGESSDWLEPLPPYEGPYAGLDQKTPAGKGPVSPVSFEPFLADEKDQERPLFDWERVEDEDEAFDWSLLDPINFGTEMKEWVGLGPNQEKAREHMEKGRELMLQEKFGSAADQFGHAASRWPDSVLEEDALFFQGECYFFSDRYTKAMECYHGLIKKYQGTQHMDTATRRLFAIGRYWEMHADQGASFVNVADKTRPTFDIFGKAKKAYEAIYLNDPLGPLADDSVMAIANAYFRRGKTRGDSDFSEAAFYYEYLRKNYPNSEHVIKAAKREIQSRHLKYSGPEYDATPLEETQELAERTMYQFGSELGEDRRDLVELRNRNQEDLAKRLWTLAQYYEKKRYYGSARIIYQKLMKKYPSTSFFQRAKERYREIEDRPAEPNRFDWLTDLF
jgi:TolA-binding protein